MNESEIIKGCLRNDRGSQKVLFEFYYDQMFGVCLRYANSETEAKDIVLEGFLKVFVNLNRFNQTGTLEAWIKRIMVNSALDKVRKNKHNYLIVSTVYADDTVLEIADEITDEELVLQIDKEEILKAVQQLTPAYRTVFNLYVLEEYTHKEIAEMLDISEGTSKSNLSKAKYNLRKNLIHLIKTDNG